jgi:hypothetical protein
MIKSFLSKPLWTLHNPLKGWTLQGMTHDEVCLLVSTLTTAEVNLSLAWRTDWKEWKKLNATDCQELFRERKNVGANPPPIAHKLIDDEHDETTQVRPALKLKEKTARKFHRCKVDVPCDIIVGEHVFSTRSQDISGGGFCFTDSLPEWVAGYFTVVLKKEPALEFTCRMVEDQKQNRLRAEIMDNSRPEAVEALQEWLEKSNFPRV